MNKKQLIVAWGIIGAVVISALIILAISTLVAKGIIKNKNLSLSDVFLDNKFLEQYNSEIYGNLLKISERIKEYENDMDSIEGSLYKNVTWDNLSDIICAKEVEGIAEARYIEIYFLADMISLFILTNNQLQDFAIITNRIDKVMRDLKFDIKSINYTISSTKHMGLQSAFSNLIENLRQAIDILEELQQEMKDKYRAFAEMDVSKTK